MSTGLVCDMTDEPAPIDTVEEPERPDGLDVERPDWGELQRELLAEKLYRASYTPGGSEYPIQPLHERPEWERAVWARVADAAIEEI